VADGGPTSGGSRLWIAIILLAVAIAAAAGVAVYFLRD
jgi:flagellar basal body-associated protein FliL